MAPAKYLTAFLVICAALMLPARAEEYTPDGVRKIVLLQVNDVYQTMPVDKGKRGGLARVATVVQQQRGKRNDTLFMLAGDTLSPSVASRVFKGAQMIAAWNAMGLDIATLGNHEFDFGPDILKQRIAESKFQWVCANVIDKQTGKTFDNLPPYIIREVNGVKVGIIGLLTTDTLRSSHAGPTVDILDPCETAKKYVPQMRAEGAEIVVGLTHLTMPNDKQVCHCAGLDAVIGGHEHYVMHAVSNGALIVKAGSDARNLGKTTINYLPSAHAVYSTDTELLPVTDKDQADPKVEAVVAEYEGKLSKTLDDVIAETKVELDARQADNQTKETNLADFIADAYRAETHADAALLNGGSIRANTTFGPGPLTRRNVLEILPFENPIVKMQVSGATIRQALEKGVGQIGVKPGGRFPQVSGIRYEYDARRPPGSRVLSVEINGQPLADSKMYTLATNNFVAEGGDDYTMLENQKLLITPEEGETEAATFASALTKAKVIAPTTDGRAKRVDAPGS